jgi:hypothetical protein
VASTGGAGFLQAPPDPPEQAFAVPIVYRAVRAVSPLGLLVGADYDVRRALEVLGDVEAIAPDVAGVARCVEAILRLVARASEQAGLDGVVEPGARRDAAFIPGRAALARLAAAVQISRTELDRLIGADWPDVLDPLISDGNVGTVTFDGSNGTLSYQPLVRALDGVILAVPGMVLPALTRHVERQLARLVPMESSRAYASRLWADIERSLGLMRMERHDDANDRPGLMAHRLYRVDEEQLLAAALIALDPYSPEDQPRPEDELAAAHHDLLAQGTGHVLVVLWHAHDEGPAFFGLERPPDGVTDLLLTPADLAVIARTEVGEPRALAEFAEASTRIREAVHVFGFSMLDEYAIYHGNQSSYYLSDDGRPTTLIVTPGSAVDLRVKAAHRDVVDVVTSPADGEPVVVMPRYDWRRGIYGPVGHVAQPARVVMTNPAQIWVVAPPYAQIASSDAESWWTALDTVAYWLWELRDDLAPLLERLPSPGRPAVVLLGGIEDWRDGRDTFGVRPIVHRVQPDENAIFLRLSGPFAELSRTPDNGAERLLVASLLEAFASLSGEHVLRPLNEIVDTTAPFGVKKMLLLIDANTNVDIGPDDVPHWRAVRDAPAAHVLDELGAVLRADGHEAGPAEGPEEREALLRLAVAKLYGTLEAAIATFDPTLLEQLLVRNEAVLRERAERGFHLPARMACFPEDAPDLSEAMQELSRASVSGRFLIEYVAARPPTGTRVPTLSRLDRLLALADTTISLGHAADLEYLGLADTNARMLRSGRLGVNTSAMRDAVRAYAPSFAERHSAEAADAFVSRWRDAAEPAEGRLQRIDEAARHEWGFTMTEMATVTAHAIGLSLDAERAVISFEVADAVAELSQASGYPPDLVHQVVDELSLHRRDDFLAPPGPFRRTDVFPWRYNRRLSLLRRPFVIRRSPAGMEVVFGRRALHETGNYLMELIGTSRLRPASREMAVLMGAFSTQRGKEFNERVVAGLAAVLGTAVRSGVKKVSGRRLAADANDLGDIDALGADVRTGLIWAVECKALSWSRTPHEIASEIKDLEGSGEKLGLLGKHERRLAWLRDNVDAVISELRLEARTWEVRGAFVVDIDLLAQYLRPTAIPIWTLSRFLREVEETRSMTAQRGFR